MVHGFGIDIGTNSNKEDCRKHKKTEQRNDKQYINYMSVVFFEHLWFSVTRLILCLRLILSYNNRYIRADVIADRLVIHKKMRMVISQAVVFFYI